MSEWPIEATASGTDAGGSWVLHLPSKGGTTAGLLDTCAVPVETPDGDLIGGWTALLPLFPDPLSFIGAAANGGHERHSHGMGDAAPLAAT